MWKWVIASIICIGRHIFFSQLLHSKNFKIHLKKLHISWRLFSLETLLCFSVVISWACTLALRTNICLQCPFLNTRLNVFVYMILKKLHYLSLESSDFGGRISCYLSLHFLSESSAFCQLSVLFSMKFMA